MPSQTFISRTSRIFVTLVVALPALHARAQIIDLPQVISTQSVIGSSEQAQIDSFIASHAEQIDSGDTATIVRSRNALIKPLQSPNITLAFRQAYSASVLPIVETLVASTETVHQLAGLRIAGKLGTDAASEILRRMLESPDEATRFFTVTSLGETMASLASNSPSLSATSAADTIAALGDIITSSDATTFADAAVRALSAATKINDPDLEPTRSLAIQTLAEAAGDRLHNLQPADPNSNDEMIVALRACSAVRVAITNVQMDPTAAAATAAVRLGADSVGYVFGRVRSGIMAQSGSNEVEIALIQIGEGTIYRGRLALGGNNLPQTNLFEQLKKGDERVFNFRASELIGPESQIVADFGFARDRFIQN